MIEGKNKIFTRFGDYQKKVFLFYTKYLLENDVEIQK